MHPHARHNMKHSMDFRGGLLALHQPALGHPEHYQRKGEHEERIHGVGQLEGAVAEQDPGEEHVHAPHRGIPRAVIPNAQDGLDQAEQVQQRLALGVGVHDDGPEQAGGQLEGGDGVDHYQIKCI